MQDLMLGVHGRGPQGSGRTAKTELELYARLALVRMVDDGIQIVSRAASERAQKCRALHLHSEFSFCVTFVSKIS
jgi:hypothetical protein